MIVSFEKCIYSRSHSNIPRQLYSILKIFVSPSILGEKFIKKREFDFLFFNLYFIVILLGAVLYLYSVNIKN